MIIDTDSGIVGISEPSTYGVPHKIRQEIQRRKPALIGKDIEEPSIVPANTGDHNTDIVNAGIDLALWDIRAKAAGKRVAELLTEGWLPGPQSAGVVPIISGNFPREPLEQIRLYASAGVQYDWDNNPLSVIDEAIGLAEEGYTAYKMRLGTHWGWSGVTVDHFLELVYKMTEAVGERMELMLEGNCRLTEEEAFRIGRVLDELGWTWFEEPISKENISGYARLSSALKIPITGGESNSTLAQFEPFFQQKAYSIVQPDVGVCSLTEGIRIVRRAYEEGIKVCPQNWHNGLLTMANAHLVAALPEPLMLEIFTGQGPLQWEILQEKPVIREGYMELPKTSGWGVFLAEDLEERFPYIEGPWGVKVEEEGEITIE